MTLPKPVLHLLHRNFNLQRNGVRPLTVTSVVAKTRALKAEYTSELAQDLKAVHGLDAEVELANILSAEILAEINREVVRTIYNNAKLGAQQSDLTFKVTTGFSGGAGKGCSQAGGVYDLEPRL